VFQLTDLIEGDALSPPFHGAIARERRGAVGARSLDTESVKYFGTIAGL
jgi:hypothetical protein